MCRTDREGGDGEGKTPFGAGVLLDGSRRKLKVRLKEQRQNRGVGQQECA